MKKYEGLSKFLCSRDFWTFVSPNLFLVGIGAFFIIYGGGWFLLFLGAAGLAVSILMLILRDEK